MKHVQSLGVGRSSWVCELKDEDVELSGQSFVSLPDLDTAFFKNNKVKSGETTLIANRATIDKKGLHIPTGSTPILGTIPPRENQKRGNRRSLAANTVVTGNKSVLVVRVRSSVDGAETTASEAALYQSVFADAANLKSQTLACSHGKLNFTPATGYSAINNGVITVVLNATVTGREVDPVEDEVIAAAKVQLGVSSLWPTFNHVMICMPPGTKAGDSTGWYVECFGSKGSLPLQDVPEHTFSLPYLNLLCCVWDLAFWSKKSGLLTAILIHI